MEKEKKKMVSRKDKTKARPCLNVLVSHCKISDGKNRDRRFFFVFLGKARHGRNGYRCVLVRTAQDKIVLCVAVDLFLNGNIRGGRGGGGEGEGGRGEIGCRFRSSKASLSLSIHPPPTLVGRVLANFS